jgi:hypothetical protein
VRGWEGGGNPVEDQCGFLVGELPALAVEGSFDWFGKPHFNGDAEGLPCAKELGGPHEELLGRDGLEEQDGVLLAPTWLPGW